MLARSLSHTHTHTVILLKIKTEANLEICYNMNEVHRVAKFIQIEVAQWLLRAGGRMGNYYLIGTEF